MVNVNPNVLAGRPNRYAHLAASAIFGSKATIDLTADTVYSFANVSASDLTDMFTIDIDGSGSPVTVDLSDLAGSTTTMTGVAIAKY